MGQKRDTTNLAWGMRMLIVLLGCHLSIAASLAQDEPEYRMEIGGGLAMLSYQGDFSGSLLGNVQPLAAIVAKYKMNPRMAWSAQLSYSQLKGSSKDTKSWYPTFYDSPVDFKNSLASFSVRYEYNFWPFGTGREYRGARPLTPFIALGAGLAFAGKATFSPELPEGNNISPESAVAFEMPIGLGVKYKLADRLNLTAEWIMHFTGSDKLDGVKDPYGIKSSGLFKNTDSYSTLQLSLTYDIWARCKTCHNDL